MTKPCKLLALVVAALTASAPTLVVAQDTGAVDEGSSGKMAAPEEPSETSEDAEDSQTPEGEDEPADDRAEETAEDPALLYENALAAFEAREWATAAELFTKALSADPNPILAYNAGRAHEYTGDLAEAERLYLEALQLSPDAELRKLLYDTLERIANVKQQVEGNEEAIGLLEVRTEPSGASVYVDGTFVGRSPYQSAHPSGTFTVDVEMEGHTPFSQKIDLEAGREVVVTANLPEEGRLWTWITLGTGLALVGGGVWLGLVAQDKLDEADSVEGKRLEQDEFDTLRDEGETAALGSLLLYGAGALTLAASVVIFFVEGPADRAPAADQTSVRFLLGPGFTGVAGTF